MDVCVDSMGEAIIRGVLVMSGVIWPKLDFFVLKYANFAGEKSKRWDIIVHSGETILLALLIGGGV